MIRYFWRYRYFNLVFILVSCIFCVFSFTDLKVYFDSERIIELVDVEKDVIEKSIDDSNLLLVSLTLSDTLSYKRALDISLALDSVNANKKISSIRSLFNERALITQSVVPITVKLLELENIESFERSFIKIDQYNSNFLSDDFKSLLFVIKCKNLNDEYEKIKLLTYLDNQFSNIFNSEVSITGQIKSEIYMKANVMKELRFFILFSALLCSLVLFYFTRSYKLVIVSLLSILISIIFSFTISNFLFGGIELVMIIIPAIIFIITISDFMHLLNFKKIYKNKYRLFRLQLMNIGKPVFLTSLTTAIGFLSFTFGSFEPLMRFGIVTTLSIFVSLFVIVSLFAFSVDLRWLNRSRASLLLAKTNQLINSFKPYKKWILIIFLAFSFLGLINLRVDNYLTDEINEKSELYKDIQHFEENFGGIKPLSFTLNNYHGSSNNYIYFLKENDINTDLILNRSDRTLIKTRIKDIGALKSQLLYEKMQKHATANNYNLDIGGIGYLFDQISNDLTYEILIGLLLAIVLIGVIFVFLNNFNIRYFLVSLAPNLVPLFSCLGVMSIFGFYLSLSNAFIFAIVFGLIVDDSIHIISAYSINRRANKSISESLKYCKNNTFQAVIKTTIVIIISLIPLLFSEFRSISQLAYVTILSAIIALIFDILFLPVLLKKYIK